MKIVLHEICWSGATMSPVVAEFTPEVGEWPLGMDQHQLSEKHFKDFALFPALMELMKAAGEGMTVHMSCGGWVFPWRESFGVRISADHIALKITTFSEEGEDVEVCFLPNVRQHVENRSDGKPLPPETLSIFVLAELQRIKRDAHLSLAEAHHALAVQTARVRALTTIASI